MRDRDLYAQVLGLERPWKVSDVRLDRDAGEVTVDVGLTAAGRCPVCDKSCPTHDHVKRKWRHLDTCQYRTILAASVPRIRCAEHGVKQVRVPWAEPGSRFTALFEALVIDWMKEASLNATARLLSMSWDEVAGIMDRAVARGLRRLGTVCAVRLGVDETSFQRRHEYVTVVSDQETGKVLYVADHRRTSTLGKFYKSLTQEQLNAIEVVAMDMCAAYISATRKHVPESFKKIAYDRFHVSKCINDAVDRVRREEHRELTKEGDRTLTGTRYAWISDPSNLKTALSATLDLLKESALRTARAWAIKEMAKGLWSYVTRGWARRAWNKWLSWAQRCRLEPMKKAAATIRRHLDGILNAIALNATNAGAESINAKIQKVKAMACGFRNRDRFRMAIYFHLGGLDLYPESCRLTHTNS